MSKKKEYLEKYKTLSDRLLDKDVSQDHVLFTKIAREIKSIEPIVLAYKELDKIEEDSLSFKDIIKEAGGDKEIIEMTQLEIESLRKRENFLLLELKRLFNPSTQEDNKSIILEIRAGAGGDESALFASEMYRMYTRFMERKGFKISLMSLSSTEKNGIKEVIISIDGHGAYGLLKYEMGTHRVQRIPETETNGRVHTSTVTVAVLAEVDDEEIEINESDLKIDTFRASGAGGQHVNTTDSAVRITHIPTGTVVSCQDERSQIKNRSKAMKILKAKIVDEKKKKLAQEISDTRRQQVGTGDRSERIRTYNFPQSRITDHRIGKTMHKLDRFMMGEIDEMVEVLQQEAMNAEI